ncbi:MAG: hypothetical protein JNL13_01210 [Chitinophagaceae bacterium]|nr:hypothetical protein [Chitinophagaceae bacterium]
MMKGQIFRLIAIVVSLNMFAFRGYAQNAKEVSIELAGIQQPGFQGDYKHPSKLVTATLEDELKKAGITKGKKYKGFKKYEGVNFPALSDNKVDVYTKVKGKKNTAYVQMLVSTGYDNFINMQKDAALATKSINFLNKLNEDAVAFQAAIDLEAQKAALKKAEEQHKKAEEKQAKALKEQDEARKKAEAERLRLENLKGQNMNK